MLECLLSDGIPVIVLKGAYLAEAVYDDPALRTMSDADLMVRKTELTKARTILQAMGGIQQHLEDVESCCEYEPHLPTILVRELPVDVHWTIVIPKGPFRVDSSDLWDRARPATIAGVEALTLSPEDTLLHLCLHFSHKHYMSGLRFLCDITQVIQRMRHQIDWTQVTGRAHAWGAARHVGLTLHLARSMLGAGVPDAAMEQLVPGGIDPRILEAAFESIFELGMGYGQWMPFFDLLGEGSVVGKARLSWRRVFLSRKEMAERYPMSRNSRLLFPYYVLRIRDGIGTYMSHVRTRRRLIAQGRERDANALLIDWLESGKP